ncbi:DUF6603 domain-containing protein [Pseudomonas sp. Marseille-P9899]|uniref:DUF6603 domain-containing protein n=1 Tax=Pseudomonas sp. Marseille-P9899 TaxID=2730401 RepID=UPI00158D004A|nr:DUF6603 domain-containing protein [Pseudomonas sp. Marseille-P9899]
MTAMNNVSPDLSQLQAQLTQKKDASGTLALGADTTGISALDTLFGASNVSLADADIGAVGSDWPRSFSVSGTPSGDWTLTGLAANAAISQLSLTFTQTAQGAAITFSLETAASVTQGKSVIGFSGNLDDDDALVLQLTPPDSNLPLLAVGNFAFRNRFGGWLPVDLPLFSNMPFSQIEVQASYGDAAETRCDVTTGVNGDWTLVQGGPSLKNASVTLASDSKVADDKPVTQLSGRVDGSLQIGGQLWAVSVNLNGSSQVAIAVKGDAGQQPALAALAGLIAGDAAAATVTTQVASLPLANLVLNSVDIAFDWQQGKLLSSSVAATLPFTFNSKPADLLLAVSLPPLDVGGKLSADTPVKIRDVVTQYLGDASGFPDTTVTTLAFSTVPSEGSYGFALAMNDVFSAGPLALDKVSVNIDKSAEATTGKMNAELTLAEVGIEVAAVYGKGWQISGSTGKDQSIDVGKLLSQLASSFGVTCPASLNEFKLKNLAVSLDTGASDFTFACEGSFPIAGVSLDFSVDIELSKPKTAWQGNFTGEVVIGAATFKVTFTQDSKVKLLRAELVPTAGKTLALVDVAQTFAIDLSGVPAELLPVLKQASFTYDFNKSQLVLTASTDSVAVSLVCVPAATTGRLYAAVVDIQVEADISQLPVVGSHLAAIENIGLNGMSLVIASGVFSADEITAVNAVIPEGLPVVPALSATGRVVLSANLMLGGKAAKPLQLAFAQPEKPKQALLADADVAANAPTPAGNSKAQGKWVNVQKSFGPISLSRVGVVYRDQRVWLMLDGGFAMGGINIELMGASIAFRPVLPPIPDGASLDGVFIGYSNASVTIAGGLLKVVTEDDKGQELIEYDGQLLLKLPQFQLSALASYASLDGSPSLFAYAVLSAPIGGPPFLQVDALAAGFGFNRDLVIPGLDTLDQMPLIAAVNGDSPFAGKDPSQALKVMHNYVPPRYGEYFLALGVRVASFQMIKGFLLATGKLGNEFEIALLGLATVSVPPATPSPIGYAELVLKADYNFNRGTLFLGAQLTANSYILAKDCHLTGGFVVAAWTKDNPDDPNGYKAGDFVVSLGGYHPAYSKPSWYPDVPRLGFNWNVTSELTVKGGLYFALVPSAVMAGGSLEAVWQSGDLRAWFKAWVDFLLGWKPFHYDASIGISLGASYKVNLGITSFTVSVNVGVQVHLWGPVFAGTATADLFVISITISFGDSANSQVTPIDWSDFKSSFLPGGGDAPPKNAPHRLLLADLPQSLNDSTPVKQTDSVCLVRVANGMLQDLKGVGGMDWVLDPERFELTTWSAVPSKQASYTGSGAVQNIAASNTDFGVGPVGVNNANFASSHTVVISKLDGEMSAEDIRVDVSAVLENLPSATWSTTAALDPSLANLNDTAARSVPNAMTGLRIAAKTDNPDVTPLPIDLGVLREEIEDQRSVVWPVPSVPTASGYPQTDTLPVFTKALVDPTVSAARSAILAQLAVDGLTTATSVDVSALAANAANTLLHAPVLSVLGAQPSSSTSGAARP